MGWLQLVGSFKLKVSFAKEPYKRDYILQKRPIIYTAQSKHPKQVTRDLYMSEETYIYQTLILHRSVNLRHAHIWISHYVRRTHIWISHGTHTYGLSLFHEPQIHAPRHDRQTPQTTQAPRLARLDSQCLQCVCDMTHPRVRDVLTCVKWRIHVCNGTRPHVRDMTHSYVRRDSIIQMCDVTHAICERHDSFTYATWLTHVCDETDAWV